MPFIVRKYLMRGNSSLIFPQAIGLSMAICLSGPSLAGQLDCEKMRTGKDPIHLTMQNVPETEFKKPPEKTNNIDIIRDRPEGFVGYVSVNGFTIKSVITKTLIPISVQFIGKTPPLKYEYDIDVTKIDHTLGKTVAFNGTEEGPGGLKTTETHHEITVLGEDTYSLAGCSFPVTSVHHTTHFKRDNKEWDIVIDSLVSFDLGVALRRRVQTVADPSVRESGIVVSNTTDLSIITDASQLP